MCCIPALGVLARWAPWHMKRAVLLLFAGSRRPGLTSGAPIHHQLGFAAASRLREGERGWAGAVVLVATAGSFIH